jgi:hypothetical protein
MTTGSALLLSAWFSLLAPNLMPSSEISIRPPTHSPSVAFESAAAAPGTASVKADAVAFG